MNKKPPVTKIKQVKEPVVERDSDPQIRVNVKVNRLEQLQERWGNGYDKQDDINPDDYAWLLGHCFGLQAKIDDLIKEKKNDLRRRFTDICRDLENGTLFREDLEPYISEIEKLLKEHFNNTPSFDMGTRVQKTVVDLGCKFPPIGWYCTREPGHEPPCAAWPKDASKVEFIGVSIDSNPECQCGCKYSIHLDGGSCDHCALCPKFRALP